MRHDHARWRAYRWGEDGLAGFSDVEQRLCLSFALWNGRDPILKQRIFGLTDSEGHGEDAKEYWWYLDAVPSHASKKGWWNKKKQQIANRDLWEELLELVEARGHVVNFEKVVSHVDKLGRPSDSHELYNQRCDELAVAAIAAR